MEILQAAVNAMCAAIVKIRPFRYGNLILDNNGSASNTNPLKSDRFGMEIKILMVLLYVLLKI